MKLFFDARYIRVDHHDGISRYSTELARGVFQAMPNTTFLICDQRQAGFLPDGATKLLIHDPTSWKEPFSAFFLNRHHPDVVFSPMQTIGSLGRRFKLILTLHDMIYYHFRKPPTHLSLPIRVGWWLFHAAYWPQRLVLNGANIVATVSETSRAEILSTRLTKRPVVVIPNAPNDLAGFLRGKRKSPSNVTNLVYMGSFMPYKNVETLIDAMSELPEYTLHLLSRITPERKRELKARTKKGSGAIIFHGGTSDEDYAKLLTNGALLVTASFIEGYGLPLAEAATLGTPSVISDIPIFREVAGKGALYFDPNDPSDVAAKVRAASEPKTYEKLATAARTINDRYSWDKSAQILLQEVRHLK